MATEDPMCWQADPNAMWNWNGLFREGVAGNHQAAIPDGRLCSAGHNPLTQPLRWSDLELAGEIGNTPAAQCTPESAGGVSIQVGANARGRSGRHMVYTSWQASNLDQSYYFCSDVNLGGATASRSASPSASPSASRSTQPSASPSASPPGPHRTSGSSATGAAPTAHRR